MKKKRNLMIIIIFLKVLMLNIPPIDPILCFNCTIDKSNNLYLDTNIKIHDN